MLFRTRVPVGGVDAIDPPTRCGMSSATEQRSSLLENGCRRQDDEQ